MFIISAGLALTQLLPMPGHQHLLMEQFKTKHLLYLFRTKAPIGTESKKQNSVCAHVWPSLSSATSAAKAPTAEYLCISLYQLHQVFP